MTPTDKPMTVDALLDELVEAARLLGSTQASKDFGAYMEEDAMFERSMYESIAKHRAAIEQYGREQSFESTAQRDVREACCELRDALGNPVISGTGDQTLQGQTIRMAAAKLRETAATSRPVEDCVPAPPFDPAAEPPWHRSDMGPAGRGSGEPVASQMTTDDACRFGVWWSHKRKTFTTARQAAWAAWTEAAAHNIRSEK